MGTVKEEIASLEWTWPGIIETHENPDGSTTIELPVHLDLLRAQSCVVHNTSKNTVEVQVNHLPPLFIKVQFPIDYPSAAGPAVSIDSIFSLSENSRAWIAELIGACEALWAPGQQSAYFIIDHVQNILASHAASTPQLYSIYSCEPNSVDLQTLLGLDTKPKDPFPLSFVIESYNQRKVKLNFNDGIFTCSICLEECKGHDSLMLDLCKHIFCLECLKSYFTYSIEKGLVDQIQCPDPDCIRARADYEKTAPSSGHLSKPGDILKSDLKIILSHDEVEDSNISKELLERYDWLVEKVLLEKDPGLTFCPRTGCQAPVPSPSELNEENADHRYAGFRTCPACDYSYCAFCSKTWHGPTNKCDIRKNEHIATRYMEGSKEEQARLELRYGANNIKKIVKEHLEETACENWKSSNTQACPGCNISIEKSQGCNHMTCWKCMQHFCFRCSARLDAKDPYPHFNNRVLFPKCFDKLFDYKPWTETEID